MNGVRVIAYPYSILNIHNSALIAFLSFPVAFNPTTLYS